MLDKVIILVYKTNVESKIINNIMSKKKKPEQKLLSFLDRESDFEKIQLELDKGWFISSIFSNGQSFVSILEKKPEGIEEEEVYIPPRKKIKITI